MAQLPEVGDRVRMVGVMENDPDPMAVGDEGTVEAVNVSSLGVQIDVTWDNGRTLFLVGEDPFIVF